MKNVRDWLNSDSCQGWGIFICNCGGDTCFCGLDGEPCPGCPECQKNIDEDEYQVIGSDRPES